MTTRHYRDDTTIDDVRSGDQLTAECQCGRVHGLAWRTLPRSLQFTPLRDLRLVLVCTRCGHRSPTMIIRGFKGISGHLHELWRWPS